MHGAFILFALGGAVLTLRWPRAVWLHLPAAVWAAGIAVSGAVCPLTHLEVALRERAGQQGYAGGFVEHYLLPLIYPPGLTPALQWVLAAFVLAVNLLLYGWLRRRRAKGPRA